MPSPPRPELRDPDSGSPCSVARPATRQPTSIGQNRAERRRRTKLIPTTIGQYVPAFGRCRWPRVLVRRCPVCGRGPSLHRVVDSTAADGAVKQGTCGHRYRLRVRASLGVIPA